MEPSQVFSLSFRERRRLHDRSYRAQQRDHLEVCGALVADARDLLHLVFLKNQTAEPYQFSIDRSDMRGVREAALQQGRRVIGTFHSHPIGHAEPGPRDRRSCPNGAYMLIYDVCGRMPRLWQIQRRRGRRQAREVAIRLEARP